jgi:hypothetical protein
VVAVVVTAHSAFKCLEVLDLEVSSEWKSDSELKADLVLRSMNSINEPPNTPC